MSKKRNNYDWTILNELGQNLECSKYMMNVQKLSHFEYMFGVSLDTNMISNSLMIFRGNIEVFFYVKNVVSNLCEYKN